MSAHTPGPWGSYESPAGLHYLTSLARPGLIIARVDRLDDGLDNDAKALEARANARLIAASPKLLAALERLALCVAGMDQFSLDEDFEAARDAARAAIATAKGTHEPT